MPAGVAARLGPSSTVAADYLEVDDGAKIYYEEQGQGQPILLVHGWMCSSRFWRKNVPELAREFRVVTVDLRGYGRSSKALTGHTMAQYARDVRTLMEHLKLQDVVLAGWSMGGSVVLSYYDQYRADCRLQALALVDAAPFPFSPADWNSHALRGYNYDGMQATFAAYTADPRKFATSFAIRILKEKPSAADLDWIVTEMLKTPPWIAEAAYSDFLMSNCAKILPSIDHPVVVFAANSEVFANGIAMGKAIAGQVPQATFVAFDDAGHTLFYERPQKFNAALVAFIKSPKPCASLARHG